MKKVIVTGATGFIGGALTKKFLDQGVTVYGIDIDTDRLKYLESYGDFIPITADFSKYSELDNLISSREFDCFIHTAWSAPFGGENYYNYALHNRNIDSTCIACEMAHKLSSKRFVFCGSSYQNMISLQADFPVNYYGISKRTASAYCMAVSRKSGMECNIAILTNTYGIGDTSKKSVNIFVKKLLNNEDLNLIDGNMRNDWMYVDDTVNGLIDVSTSPFCFKQYYVGHRTITTFKEKLLEMKSALQSSSNLYFGKYEDDTFVDYNAFDLDALYKDTGFECKADFRESVLKTAEWVKTLDW